MTDDPLAILPSGAKRAAIYSAPSSLVPKPTLSQVIIEKIREGATLEETKQYYGFMREIQRDEARVQFDADFVVMQGELPEVPKLGRIDHGGGRGYNYARWEDINDRIKPVLQKYGFGLRFDIITETETLFEIEAILVHRSGYSICTRKKLPIDKAVGKNIVQAYGSTQSYAQRYSAIALLNLTSRNEDTDANPKPDEFITDDQVAEIYALLDEDEGRVDRFCKLQTLRKVSDMPASRFDGAVAAINAVNEKIKAKAAEQEAAQ